MDILIIAWFLLSKKNFQLLLPLENNQENASLIEKLKQGYPLINIDGSLYFATDEQIKLLENYFKSEIEFERNSLLAWAKKLPEVEKVKLK